MILYENTDFAANAKASDYVFTAVENFIHEWSLQAQRHIPSLGLINHPAYKKLVAVATSLDELKVWFDMHVPNAKILYEMSYGELVKQSKI